MLVGERQREMRASATRVRKSLARHITALEKELPIIDSDIDTMVRGSLVWREKEDLLVTFRGVSNKLARTFLAHIPELGRLTRRRIASLGARGSEMDSTDNSHTGPQHERALIKAGHMSAPDYALR